MYICLQYLYSQIIIYFLSECRNCEWHVKCVVIEYSSSQMIYGVDTTYFKKWGLSQLIETLELLLLFNLFIYFCLKVFFLLTVSLDFISTSV